MIRFLVPILGLCVVTGSVLAASPGSLVRRVSWSELASSKQLQAGTITHPTGDGPREALRIENPAGTPRTFRVTVLDRPGVKRKAWAVSGLVRYEAVEGAGYLELWSTLPGGESYFSRTLAPEGPLGQLHGSSGWRKFVLPFQAERDEQRPDRLTFDVVLPGRGTVEIGPLELFEGANAMSLAGFAGPTGSSHGAWWDDRTGGRVGAALGVLIGLLGVLVGALASRGSARRFVEGSLVAGGALGILLLLAGVFALGGGQPAGVHGPLLFGGGLLAVLAPLLLRTVRQRYREVELRRITALDALG